MYIPHEKNQEIREKIEKFENRAYVSSNDFRTRRIHFWHLEREISSETCRNCQVTSQPGFSHETERNNDARISF